MGKFAVGEVVLVSFPFSNLQGQKIRPALVLAISERDDLILSQITSRPYSSNMAIRVSKDDFKKGSLPVVSYVRQNKLFTAHSSIIKKSAGQLTSVKTKLILRAVRSLFK